MRLGRFFFGAVVIVLALWAIIGEQITGASSNAIVNARLSTIRSPIPGIIDVSHTAVGTEFQMGETVARVKNTLVDTDDLSNLQMDASITEAEIASLNNILKITDTEITDLEFDFDNYLDTAIVRININISRSEERLRLLSAVEAGLLADEAVKNSIELSLVKENLEIQREIRSSLLNKSFMGAGNDILYQLQTKLKDRNVYRSNLFEQLGLTEQKLVSIEERIISEHTKVVPASNAVLRTKSHTLLWEILVADGEIIERGQELLKLVICNSQIVTFSVGSSLYNTLAVGQPAIFYLDNTDLSYEGTISRLAGARASRIYKSMAIPPSQKNEDRYDVTLSVPKLRNEVNPTCQVGQTGRIFFERRPFDWLRELIN